MDAIDQLWLRIETARNVQMSRKRPQLAAGASEEAIGHLEGLLDVSLPQDFRASYRRHDGGFNMKPVTRMEILPLSEIAEWWQILEKLLHDEEWANQPPYYFSEEVERSGWQTGPIQPVWWHRRWIPFASDSTGNLTCLDLAPAAGGAVGQVIDWDHECGPSRVLFPGFQHLLSALADQVERNSKRRRLRREEEKQP